MESLLRKAMDQGAAAMGLAAPIRQRDDAQQLACEVSRAVLEYCLD